ncbi:MAG: extracellular solute-binding protein [bacterium]|nr:extracellular solute-binding protein [bacterium]
MSPQRNPGFFGNNPFDRRSLNKALAASGLSLAVVPMFASPVRASDLTLYEWGGYELPEFHPEYTAATGGSPEFTFFADEEEALQKIRAGFRPDLSHPCVGSIGRWRDAGVIKPIDTARIERWDDIIPSLLEFEGLVVDGEAYFMPWEFGYTAVAYNPALIDPADQGFSLLIDPAFKGRISCGSQIDEAVVVGGVIGGFADPFVPTEDEIAQLPDIWRQLITNARFLWSTISEYEQAMASGEVAASYIWTQSIPPLAEEGVELRIVDPVLPWMCGLVLNTDGAGDEDLAYAYMNAMLDPQAGKALVELYGYGHANRNTYPLVSDEILAANGLTDPVSLLSKGIFFKAIPERDRLITMWEEVQAGI